MKQFFLVLQIVTAVVLCTLILLQSSKGGLGAAFGGGSYHTKRGAERVVFTATMVTGLLFLLLAIANVMVS